MGFLGSMLVSIVTVSSVPPKLPVHSEVFNSQ